MSRAEPEVITIRVTEEFKELILRIAVQGGYLNKAEAPNVSTAVKMLLSVALDNGNGQEIAKQAYASARAGLLQELQALVSDAYSDIAEELK